jgi:dethiobiotin synthetase
LDGVEIDPARLDLPHGPQDRWLVIEGSGGVLVPITRDILQATLFWRWRAPAIVVARTALGTINHTLLTLEALRHRAIEVLGVLFVGDSMPDTERTISEMGAVKRLGRLPRLPSLDAASLRESFTAHFNRRDFEATYVA